MFSPKLDFYLIILQDYLQLGPLQLKLLNIRGKQMTIFKPQTPPPDEIKAKDYKPDEWPVTGNMIKKTVYAADGKTMAMSPRT